MSYISREDSGFRASRAMVTDGTKGVKKAAAEVVTA
jgi:hypothetical protein